MHGAAQLEIDVEDRTREPRLEGELEAHRGGEAGGLEVEAVVNGVVFKHDRQLHGEGDGGLPHPGVAVQRALEAVVGNALAPHEAPQGAFVFAGAGFDEVADGRQLAVGLDEVFLGPIREGLLLGWRSGGVGDDLSMSCVLPGFVLRVPLLYDFLLLGGCIALIVLCHGFDDQRTLVAVGGVVHLRRLDDLFPAVGGYGGHRVLVAVDFVTGGRAVVRAGHRVVAGVLILEDR